MTLNGIDGMSPIEYQRKTIGMALDAEKYGRSFFKNGGIPSGILKTSIKDEEVRANMTKEWKARHSGTNSSNIAIIPADWDYQALSLSNEDVQYLQIAKFQRSQIASIYGVPLHFIGDMEKATLSNVEQQSLEFVTYALRPYLVNYEQSIVRDLFTAEQRKRYFPKINVNALLRGDSQAQAEYYDKLRKTGVLSINEIRAFEDLDPLNEEGGDAHWVQLNEATLTMHSKLAEQQNQEQ
jgi:HK97 family phage portal protein